MRSFIYSLHTVCCWRCFLSLSLSSVCLFCVAVRKLDVIRHRDRLTDAMNEWKLTGCIPNKVMKDKNCVKQETEHSRNHHDITFTAVATVLQTAGLIDAEIYEYVTFTAYFGYCMLTTKTTKQYYGNIYRTLHSQRLCEYIFIVIVSTSPGPDARTHTHKLSHKHPREHSICWRFTVLFFVRFFFACNTMSCCCCWFDFDLFLLLRFFFCSFDALESR